MAWIQRCYLVPIFQIIQKMLSDFPFFRSHRTRCCESWIRGNHCHMGLKRSQAPCSKTLCFEHSSFSLQLTVEMRLAQYAWVCANLVLNSHNLLIHRVAHVVDLEYHSWKGQQKNQELSIISLRSSHTVIATVAITGSPTPFWAADARPFQQGTGVGGSVGVPVLLVRRLSLSSSRNS